MKNLIIIMIAFLMSSCVQSPRCNQPATPPPPPIPYINGLPVAEGFANLYNVYQRVPTTIILVKEGGMKYVVDYKNNFFNLTKDSLEVVALKRQVLKDSLQIEVSKKYLKN